VDATGDDAVFSAVAISHLRELPRDVLEELLSGAVRATVPAGTVTHWERDDAQHLELIVAGVIRVFVTAPDGRTMTVRYCRPGGLLGAMSLFSTEFSMPATTQALVDVELLRMSPIRVRELAESDLRVARALLIELSERARSFVYEITGGVFGTVRQRVARHLLDLVSDTAVDGPGHGLVVRVSQQELAAAVGTVREVVVRVLRELRTEGAVKTERDRIIVTDPAILTKDLAWNPSS
jgi:CRP/FNR family transcriptional regulator, cyclic AMP receptor protein